MAVRLGDVLVRHGALTPEQRDRILDQQWATNKPFGVLAEEMFGLSIGDVERAWAEQYAMMAEHVDPDREGVDPSVLGMIDRRQAWQFGMLPLRYDGEELLVCTTQELLPRALRFAGWKLGHKCYFVIAEPEALGRALQRHYPMDGMTTDVIVGAAAA
jgi:hypothetical protein